MFLEEHAKCSSKNMKIFLELNGLPGACYSKNFSILI